MSKCNPKLLSSTLDIISSYGTVKMTDEEISMIVGHLHSIEKIHKDAANREFEEFYKTPRSGLNGAETS